MKAALAKSRQQGRIGGRPRLNEFQIKKINDLKTEGNSVVAISKELKISRESIYQYLE